MGVERPEEAASSCYRPLKTCLQSNGRRWLCLNAIYVQLINLQDPRKFEWSPYQCSIQRGQECQASPRCQCGIALKSHFNMIEHDISRYGHYPVLEASLLLPSPKMYAGTDLPAPHLTIVSSSHPPSPNSTLSFQTIAMESAHRYSLPACEESTHFPHSPPSLAPEPHHPLPSRPFDPKMDVYPSMQLIHFSPDPGEHIPKVDLIT